jgi:hypothetical protein
MKATSPKEIRFAGFTFDVESRWLQPSNGSGRRLPPKPGKLLEILGHGRFVKKEVAISMIWPGNPRMDDHDLWVLKSDLLDLLGDRSVIEVVPKFGLRLLRVTKPLPDEINEEHEGKGSDQVVLPVLRIFPGALVSGDGETIPSWMGSGRNDWTNAKSRQIGLFQKLGRPAVRVSKSEKDVLQIKFRHVLDAKSSIESYWTAAVPFGTTKLINKWPLVDLRPYSRLIFSARFQSDRGSDEMLLGVRLEDGSSFGKSNSFHNQTSWYPEQLRVDSTWHPLSLDLSNFDWSELGWPGNADLVNRERMLQIDFGQDDEFPNASGILELTDIRLERE